MIPGTAPVPAANTRSFNLNPEGKQQLTQPLQLPDDTQWGQAKVASQADPNKVGSTTKAVVTSVGDGDGAKVGGLNCRLELIDAPEKAYPRHNRPGQPFAPESKKSLQEMIENKEVTVTVTEAASEKSKGRPICRIEIEGQNVSVSQLRKGMAWLQKTYGVNSEYLAMQRNNQVNGTGLFVDPNAEHPGAFRQREWYSKGR